MQRPEVKIDIGHKKYTVHEAISVFLDHFELCKEYNRVGKTPIERLTVVHGYGSTGQGGRIKLRLRELLVERHIEFQNGDGREGLGMTIVTMPYEIASGQPAENAPKAFGNLQEILSAAAEQEVEPQVDEIEELRRTLAGIPRSGQAEKRLLQAMKMPRTGGELTAILEGFDLDLMRLLIRCLILEEKLVLRDGRLVRKDYFG